MNIGELNLGDEYTNHSTYLLGRLEKNTGNCVMNGFLGEDFLDLSFDEEGRLEFSSCKEVDDVVIHSLGVALSDSVLIRQEEQDHSSSFYRLYSWDVDNNIYTFLGFDSKDALDRYFDVVKRFDICLCGEDISTLFQEMGLTFESVTQVLLNQKVDPLQRMFDEEMDEERSFSM